MNSHVYGKEFGARTLMTQLYKYQTIPSYEGRFLDASKNWLTTVPRNLCRCTKLVQVLLNQNRITQVGHVVHKHVCKHHTGWKAIEM